ncbi:hypothetical protein [Corallococcus terminator]|nr:hypothetical protein [Corallococcus terminator]
MGFALISVVTLGIAMPQRVEWRCAKAQPSPGELGSLTSTPGEVD